MNNETIVVMRPEDFEELENGNKAKLKTLIKVADTVNKAKVKTEKICHKKDKESGKAKK